MNRIWVSTDRFISGDPSLQLRYPSVSGPGTVVSCSSPGDYKWVSMGLALPGTIQVHEVVLS